MPCQGVIDPVSNEGLTERFKKLWVAMDYKIQEDYPGYNWRVGWEDDWNQEGIVGNTWWDMSPCSKGR